MIILLPAEFPVQVQVQAPSNIRAMAVELRFEKLASEAVTWVATLKAHGIPDAHGALQDAARRNVHIGLHVESRSVIMQFPQDQGVQDARRKLKGILAKGGVRGNVIATLNAMDVYHAEAWGLLPITAPADPTFMDKLVEADSDSESIGDGADSDSESIGDGPEIQPEIEEPEAIVGIDIFSIVPSSSGRTIVVPGINEAMSMDTVKQAHLRRIMVECGPLAKELEATLFPPNLERALQVQQETRALARPATVEPIYWLFRPPFIVVYSKPNMNTARRLDWIMWKAEKLGIELTVPMLMVFYRMCTFFTDNKTRLQQFKPLAKAWMKRQGLVFDWSSLSEDVRSLVHRINRDAQVFVCRGCQQVLKPGAKEFCSNYCARKFCRCGERLSTRSVVDEPALGAQGDEIQRLSTLARFAPYQAQLEACNDIHDITAMHKQRLERRQSEQCCQAIEGWMDNKWCGKCMDDWHHISQLQSAWSTIKRDGLNWGHIQAAKKYMEAIQAQGRPMMQEAFCESCERSGKRRRLI